MIAEHAQRAAGGGATPGLFDPGGRMRVYFQYFALVASSHPDPLPQAGEGAKFADTRGWIVAAGHCGQFRASAL